MKTRSNFSVIMSAFMLMLFLSYQAGTTLFTHAHVIDGRVITHSHPYNSQAHSHSDAQIFAIGHVSTFIGEEAKNVDTEIEVYQCVDKIGHVADAVFSLFVELDGHGFRAPPVCC